MKRVGLLLVLCAAARSEEWKAGPLTLEVHVSRTANLFEIVDNLSNWDRYAHAQYRRHFTLSDEDEAMLKKHAAVRRRRGWGGGLEQAFFTPLSLDEALARADLSEKEKEIERRVLLHFAPRIDALLKEERPRLEAFRVRIEKKLEDVTSFARKVSRFSHGHEVAVPVYLIANPADHDLGGGYNGGRLTVEVARIADAFPTFLHELMHAFVNRERARLRAAVARTELLDYTTLNEGIAYALSPGIFHAGNDLASQVARDEGKSLDDPYVRFRRFGLELVPLLERALDDDDATLETFLPEALEAWSRVVHRHEAQKAAEKRKPLAFSAGPAWKTLEDRLYPLYSFNHGDDHYRRILWRARRGDTIYFLFALDSPDRRIPERFRGLLPRPWPAVEKELQTGKTVEAEGSVRGIRTVVLAAPTTERLKALVQTSKLVRRIEPWFFGLLSRGTYDRLNRRMNALHHRGVAGYSHYAPYYPRLFTRAQSGDTLIIAIALERKADRIANGYEDLLPRPWPEVEKELKAGKTVELKGEARGLKTILLAAPTAERLERLLRESRLLE